MKLHILVVVLLISLIVPTYAAERQRIGPVTVSGFSQLTITKDQVSLSGPRVNVRTNDGAVEAKAQKIVIRFGADGPQTGIGSLKSASLTGDVWMLVKTDSDKSTEARSKRAEIDWATTREATLSGDAQVKSIVPDAFKGPLVITAEKAIVSLKRENELQPGEPRIRIEGDPDKSRLEFTPLSRKESE